MALSTQPYKGARDFYPEDKRLQKYIFGKLRQVVESFGYEEYDAPLIEPFEIYAAKSGEELVKEQVYSFTDRGERKVAIRPEMTPSVSRMVAARRQELAYPLRWYSLANFWRYERPQRGRLREHWQLNVDLFGAKGLEGEAEVIQIADAILKNLGAQPDAYKINVNSRIATAEALAGIGLDESDVKKVYRLIDKMAKISDEEFSGILSENLPADKAQKLIEYMRGSTPPDNITKLLARLKASGVASAKYERSVVRGLEYYTDIIFEIFDTNPENPRAMGGGGRYDGLVGLFGVEPVPTVGFAIGDVTLGDFMEGHKLLPELKSEVEARVILIGDVYEQAQPLLARLRQKMNVAVDLTDRKIDNKIRAAEKADVGQIIFIGEQEISSQSVRVKNLTTGEEKSLHIP